MRNGITLWGGKRKNELVDFIQMENERLDTEVMRDWKEILRKKICTQSGLTEFELKLTKAMNGLC